MDCRDEIDRNNRDAFRYRWLREADNYPDHDWWTNELGEARTAEDFDAAIDAAMRRYTLTEAGRKHLAGEK